MHVALSLGTQGGLLYDCAMHSYQNTSEDSSVVAGNTVILTFEPNRATLQCWAQYSWVL